MAKAGNHIDSKSRGKSKVFVNNDEENKSGNQTHMTNLREEPEILDFDGPVIAERLDANISGGEKQHIDIISALNSSIVNSNEERVEDQYYS